MCGRFYGLLRVWLYPRGPSQEEEPNLEESHHTIRRSKSVYMQQHSTVMNEDQLLVEEYGETHWRVRTYRTLHQHWFILLLAFLMVLDIIFMVVDLVLAAFYPPCTIIVQSCSCTAKNESTTSPQHLLASATGGGSDADPNGICTRDCHEPPQSVSDAMIALTICSIVILLLFLLELLVHLVVIGAKRFFVQLFVTIDLVIVIVSIGLELYLLVSEITHNHEEDAALQATTVPLIIFARSWRLLRIGHGAYKEAHDFYGEKMRKLKDRIAELERKERGRQHDDENGSTTAEMKKAAYEESLSSLVAGATERAANSTLNGIGTNAQSRHNTLALE